MNFQVWENSSFYSELSLLQQSTFSRESPCCCRDISLKQQCLIEVWQRAELLYSERWEWKRSEVTFKLSGAKKEKLLWLFGAPEEGKPQNASFKSDEEAADSLIPACPVSVRGPPNGLKLLLLKHGNRDSSSSSFTLFVAISFHRATAAWQVLWGCDGVAQLHIFVDSIFRNFFCNFP